MFSWFTVHNCKRWMVNAARWTVNGDERDMKWHFMLGWEKRMCDIIYHEQQVICFDISISSLFTVHCSLLLGLFGRHEMLWNALKYYYYYYYGCMFLYNHSHRLMHETWAFIILMTIFRTQTHTHTFTQRHCIVLGRRTYKLWSVNCEVSCMKYAVPPLCSIISKNFLISIWHISNWIVYFVYTKASYSSCAVNAYDIYYTFDWNRLRPQTFNHFQTKYVLNNFPYQISNTNLNFEKFNAFTVTFILHIISSFIINISIRNWIRVNILIYRVFFFSSKKRNWISKQ